MTVSDPVSNPSCFTSLHISQSFSFLTTATEYISLFLLVFARFAAKTKRACIHPNKEMNIIMWACIIRHIIFSTFIFSAANFFLCCSTCLTIFDLALDLSSQYIMYQTETESQALQTKPQHCNKPVSHCHCFGLYHYVLPWPCFQMSWYYKYISMLTRNETKILTSQPFVLWTSSSLGVVVSACSFVHFWFVLFYILGWSE